MKPLVSICIPTYNRAECLEKTIESIICQPEFKSGEVEIVISDNTSTDNTDKLCEQYKFYPNFFYYRNSENIRDKNFPMVLSKANGKLRKLNNDTFVLLPGSLEKLCNLVKKYDEERPLIFIRNNGKETKELNFNEFVLDVGYFVTWLASFAIWDDECEQIELDTNGCELQLWQVKKTYELAHKKDACVVYGQIVGESISPPKKDISYGLFKIFYCNYMQLLQPYVDNKSLSREDINQLEKQLLFEFFPHWIIMYELNDAHLQYSKEENLKEAVWNQYKSKPYWNEFLYFYKKSYLKTKIKIFIKRLLGKA